MSSPGLPLSPLLKDKFTGVQSGLTLLPPATTRLETISVLRQESRSAVALAELRMWLRQHHNPGIFAETMTLRECVYSSAIETKLLSLEEVIEAKAAQSSKPDMGVSSIIRCFEAITRGIDGVKQDGRLDLSLIFRTVQQLQGVNDQQDHSVQDEQSPYIRLLQNLVNYFNEPAREMSPLIKMAVQHYQFESIHPFYLENGRTGRILNLLFLQHHNVLPYPILSLSEYIFQNKIEYYHLHQQVRQQNEWANWVIFLLRGMESTVQKAFSQLREIQHQYDVASAICQSSARSFYSKSLLDLIFQRPYCKIEYLDAFDIAKRKAAGRYLRALEAAGILKMKKIGKENIFLNEMLLATLRKS